MNPIFGNGKKREPELDPFASWPQPVVPTEAVSAPQVFSHSMSVDSLSNSPVDGLLYAPSIIIGVGEPGKLVLQSLIQQIAINQSADTSQLRFVQFSYGGSGEITNGHRGIAQKQIDLDGEMPIHRQVHSSRQFYNSCFNQAAVYRAIETHFQECVNQIRSGIRVYLVASLRDPMTSIAGNILQLLRQIQARRACFSITVGLFSFDLPLQMAPIADGEAYAVLREIGRFTFRDYHVMYPATGSQDGTIQDQTLIDHLFLVDTRYLNDPNVRKLPYENGAGQMLSEALYTLLHPAGEEIHQRLANILTNAASMRMQYAEPLVNSFSAATLRAPVMELQAYVEMRLTQSAFFGDAEAEQKGIYQIGGGQEEARSLVNDIVNHPRVTHPLFSWLIQVLTVNDLTRIPTISQVDPYIQQFQWIVIDTFNKYLERCPDLKTAAMAAAIFSEKLNNVRQMGGAINYPDSQLPSWNRLRQLIDQMAKFLVQVQVQCQQWTKTLTGEMPAVNVRSSSAGGTFAVPQAIANPFRALSTNTPAAAGFVVRQAVAKQKEKALALLQNSTEGQYSHSIIEIQSDNHEDLDEFYRNVIPMGDDSASFRTIRSRMGWWLRQGGEEGVELLAVFLPGGWHAGRDKELSCYSFEYAEKLFDCVREEAARQAQVVRTAMTSSWFNEKVREKSNFLQQASRIPFLLYNEDNPMTVTMQQRPDSRLAYILGQNLPQAESYLTGTFPNLAIEQRRGLPNGEKTRLTAFAMNSFIPLHVVRLVGDFSPAYRREMVNHLYPSERNSWVYERDLRSFSQWETDSQIADFTEFCPQICSALWQRDLVRLFFHALAAGIVGVGVSLHVSFGADTRRWQCQEFANYMAFDLSDSADGLGLWKAFRNFTLVYPFRPQSITAYANRLDNPYLLANRTDFFNALLRESEERLSLQVDPLAVQKLIQEIQVSLHRPGTDNRLLRQFFLLAKFELSNWAERIEPFKEPLLR